MPSRPTQVQEHISLVPYTTLKIGGPARYFMVAKSVGDVIAAWQWAAESHVQWRVLGSGGNTLISDDGYDGLLILMNISASEWSTSSVVVGAGLTNGQLIAGALQHNLGGLRWLIGVPGTVGGSLYGNAGGHGWGLGHQVDWVEILDEQGRVRQVSQEDCQFSYRHSIFKTKPWIILRAQLNLPKVTPAEERKVLAATTTMKNNNQPTTAQSAGCMFKNPVVESSSLPEELKLHRGADGTISAWRLIVAAGLQGKQLGHIQVSPRHANFMVNLGGATADQVVQLLSLVKQQVRDKLGVQLHEEVQYIGF